MRATTAQFYPSRDTFEFDQGHMTKNQPITVFILLSESLAIDGSNDCCFDTFIVQTKFI